MNQNSFLKEFLEMRKVAKTTGQSSTGLASEVLPQTKESKKRKQKPQMKAELEREKPGLMTIIEEKPSKKVVIEYLQIRANELTVKKME